MTFRDSMLSAGNRVPPARVWIEGRSDATTLDALGAARPCLLVFYLFDWTST